MARCLSIPFPPPPTSLSTTKVSALPSPEFLFTTPKLYWVQCSSLIFPPWSCFLGAEVLPSSSSSQHFICSFRIILPPVVHFSLGSHPFPPKSTNLLLLTSCGKLLCLLQSQLPQISCCSTMSPVLLLATGSHHHWPLQRSDLYCVCCLDLLLKASGGSWRLKKGCHVHF